MKMKKVLIIGHFWPYRRGSRRTFGLAKYLREFGWEPIILTGPLKEKPGFNVKYIEIEYRNLFGIKTKKDLGNQLRGRAPAVLSPISRFILNKFMEVFAYPDEDKYWRVPAIKEIKKLFEKEKINAIVSIWPVTAHLIAKESKEKYKIPWIADFPDPWSQNHNYPYGPLRKYFDKKLELKVISSANALTAAAPLYKKRQENLHKRPVILITQGFDPQDLNHSPCSLTEKFTIIYTGSIYRGKQDPEKLLIALKKLISKNILEPKTIEIRFYGRFQGWLDKKIKKYNLATLISQRGEVSREESLQRQRESQLLLFFNWEDPKAKGVYASKIFEYLAAKRPILATGGFSADDIEKVLSETKAGIYASTVEEIENSLLDFYKEYKQNGRVSYRGRLEEIKKYSYLEMARKFADVLDKIV